MFSNFGHLHWLKFSLAFSGVFGRLAVILVVAEALSTAALPVALGFVVESIVPHQRSSILPALGACCGLIVFSAIAGALSEWFTQLGTSTLLKTLWQKVTRLVLAPSTILQPRYDRDLKHLMSQLSRWEVVDGLENELVVLYHRILALVSFIIVAVWNPVIATVILALQLVLGARNLEWIKILQNQTSEEKEHSDYYLGLLSDAQGRREMRIFGLAPTFLHQYKSLWKAHSLRFSGAITQVNTPMLLIGLGLFLIYSVSFIWLSLSTVEGLISAGQMVATIGALINLNGFGMVGSSALVAAVCSSVLEQLRTLENGVDTHNKAHPKTTHSTGVTIENLTFRYPTSTQDVLKGINLQLTPGSTTALVGANGSGKTTLMKILCGIHHPTTGVVTIEGHGHNRHTKVAAVFQESTPFPLPASDTVGLGKPGWETYIKAVGLDVEHYQHLHNATSVSGGQWQRLMLARALMHAQTRTGVLILDEPSSALDPLVERELFNDFRALGAGNTMLFITHRLGSIRNVDRILVMDNGRIVEDGTHEQLMNNRGLYRAMFEQQQHSITGITPHNLKHSEENQ